MFSNRLDAMHFMVERLPGVAPPIRKSNPDSYADTPFPDEITLIEMPRKFFFPSIKAISARRNPGSPLWIFPGPVQGSPPSSGKWKTSDKENVPYFRMWKSLAYSNRLRPALGRLYKGNLNP
ncbi:hypothetical protein F2Q69_00042270 [Brassica cretica]|uniref:Uncharacterized protein n=1 Tax=Brassica cretica TaxID=69181 RepID=A0A8S9NHY1_BRACR|nr:hypothetical protein F2Q69_00042270 [Brassica cretica]